MDNIFFANLVRGINDVEHVGHGHCFSLQRRQVDDWVTSGTQFGSRIDEGSRRHDDIVEKYFAVDDVGQ